MKMSGKLFDRNVDFIVCLRFDRNKPPCPSLFVMQIVFKTTSKIMATTKAVHEIPFPLALRD